jgi:phage-related protein
MLNETFCLDGIDARSVGIYLQSPIKFSAAVPVIESEVIPGRNGNLIFETGSYKNRKGSASCFCLQEDVEKAISASGKFLTKKKGYRRLETSNDPEHYWLARIENSPQIEMRARILAPFDISFDCKPQRFVKSGENPISFTGDGFVFNRYGQTALPFITLYGNGSGRLMVNGIVVDVKSIDGLLYLDSDTQNAYNNDGNQNMNINAPEFPTLPDGNIQVAFDGDIERVEIIPRWWEL